MIDFSSTLTLDNETEPLLKATRILTDKHERYVNGFGHSYATRSSGQVPRADKAALRTNQGAVNRATFVVDSTGQQWMLDLDGVLWPSIRSHALSIWREENDSDGPPIILQAVCWGNSGRNVCLPQMRRSSLLQPQSFMARNNCGQRCGQSSKGALSQGRPKRFSFIPRKTESSSRGRKRRCQVEGLGSGGNAKPLCCWERPPKGSGNKIRSHSIIGKHDYESQNLEACLAGLYCQKGGY